MARVTNADGHVTEPDWSDLIDGSHIAMPCVQYATMELKNTLKGSNSRTPFPSPLNPITEAPVLQNDEGKFEDWDNPVNFTNAQLQSKTRMLC